jgi:calcium-dependent protein kinase
MLTYDQMKRPTAHDCLKHKWIVEQTKSTVVDKGSTTEALSNLVNFHAHTTMKAATLTFIGSQMVSKAEREELARVFKQLDLNGDGMLSKEEIQEGYSKHYGRLISDKEIDFMFNAVDTDHSGYIDYTEFVVAAMNEKLLLNNQRLSAAFKMFDKDGSGSITPSEIKTVLQSDNKLPEKVIESIIKQVDANGDGQISFEEFTVMMQNASL